MFHVENGRKVKFKKDRRVEIRHTNINPTPLYNQVLIYIVSYLVFK